MTLDQLLTDLAQNQINLFVDGGQLRYRAPAGALRADLREGISEHRIAIIEHLLSKAPSQQQPPECIACNRRDWVDEPPKDGRIRTTCGKCGRFVGYRPENLLKTQNPLAIPRNSRQL